MQLASPPAASRRAGPRSNARTVRPRPYRNPFESPVPIADPNRVRPSSATVVAEHWPAWTDLPFPYQLTEGGGQA